MNTSRSSRGLSVCLSFVVCLGVFDCRTGNCVLLPLHGDTFAAHGRIHQPRGEHTRMLAFRSFCLSLLLLSAVYCWDVFLFLSRRQPQVCRNQ